MTLTMFRAARGVQGLGAGLALLGVVLAALSSYCTSGIHLLIGVLALGLDGRALLAREASSAILVAIAKVVVLVIATMIVIPCAAVVPDPAPLVAQGVAVSVLFASTVPSVVGALMLRVAR